MGINGNYPRISEAIMHAKLRLKVEQKIKGTTNGATKIISNHQRLTGKGFDGY